MFFCSYDDGKEVIFIMTFNEKTEFYFLDLFQRFDNFSQLRLSQHHFKLKYQKVILAKHFYMKYKNFRIDKIGWLLHAKLTVDLDHLDDNKIPIF